MNNKKLLAFISIIIASSSLSVEVQAAIYKCINTKTEVYYNDKPCPINDKESQFKAVKDPVGGYIPPEIKNNKSDVVSKSGLLVKGELNEKKISQSENKSESKTITSSSETDEENKNKSDSIFNKESLSQEKSLKIKKPVELIFH